VLAHESKRVDFAALCNNLACSHIHRPFPPTNCILAEVLARSHLRSHFSRHHLVALHILKIYAASHIPL
jgi:hypothetical protein